MQHGNPNSRFHVSNCVQSLHGNPIKSRFRVSEFPAPLRGSAEGPQNPDSMFPSVQIPGYSSANSRFRVSEFPRFQGPSVGPRREPNFQIPCYSSRGQIPGYSCAPQIPDSKIPSVQIPGYSRANSRFRVSEFPRPPLGSEPKGPPNSRFRVSKFQRPPLGSGLEGHTFQIPSFRVSEAPSWVRAHPQIPDSEFPSFRGPLSGSEPKGPPNSRFRVSEFPRPPL